MHTRTQTNTTLRTAAPNQRQPYALPHQTNDDLAYRQVSKQIRPIMPPKWKTETMCMRTNSKKNLVSIHSEAY